jgi:peptidase inhibitor I9
MFRSSRLRVSVAAGVVAAGALLLGSVTSAVASPGPAAVSRVLGANSGAAVAGSYIVKLKADAAPTPQGLTALAKKLAATYDAKVGHVWTALHGFSAAMSASDAERLAADPAVDHVTQDQRIKQVRPAGVQPQAVVGPQVLGAVSPAAAQSAPPWGLDRIDQHALPLDQHYSYDDSAGQGVHVYDISGGVDPSQPDLAGRVTLGANFVNDQATSADCTGGGTEEAGVIAGTTAGVAKKAQVVAVRVFGCNNIATATSIQDGFDWVAKNAVKPAVIMFDLQDYCVFPDGVRGCDPAVAAEYVNAQEEAFNAGIAVVAASGDSAQPNCVRTSGSAPDAIYVGASTQVDQRAGFSDFGSCLTMWAPGDQIITDAMGGGQVVDSCTCLAAAHVAGAVALLMGAPEFAGASPTQIRTELVTNRSTKVDALGAGGSPNLLLFTGQDGLLNDGEVGDPVTVTPAGDGRLMLFGVNAQGRMTQQAETAVGASTWTAPQISATAGWQSVAAQTNGDGRIEMSGLTPGGQVWDRSQAAGSTAWLNWTQLSSTPGGSPAAQVDLAHNSSNRMELFVTDRNGGLFRRAQTGANSTSWGAWSTFTGPPKLRSITSETNGANDITLLGVDDAGRVFQTAQTVPTDDNWTGFTTLPGFAMAGIFATRNSNGTLELFGVDTGGNPWVRVQTAVGSTSWSAWTPLPQRTLRNITAQADTSTGLIRVVGVDNLGRVWQSDQRTLNSTDFTSWTQLTSLTLRP